MQNICMRRGCRNTLLGVHPRCTSIAQRAGAAWAGGGGPVPGTDGRFTASCLIQHYTAPRAGLNHAPAHPLAYSIWEFASHPWAEKRSPKNIEKIGPMTGGSLQEFFLPAWKHRLWDTCWETICRPFSAPLHV